MSATTIVRAILREHPEARHDESQAYWIHVDQVISGTIDLEKPLKINTFLRIWQRHRRTFLAL